MNRRPERAGHRRPSQSPGSSVVDDQASWAAVRTGPRGAAEAEARLVLHHAVQLVAAVGQHLAARQPDDAQQSLAVGERLWLGAPLASGLRAGLDPVALALHLCGEGDRPVASLPLGGETLASGLAFLRAGLEQRGVAAGPVPLPTHPPDFPAHALAAGARFPTGPSPQRAELAALYVASAEALRQATPASTPLRLWPHHFDLAGTVQVGAVSVGLGFSPGDGPAGEPYWYATLWPRPEGALPELRGRGRWHLAGWFGAELPLALLSEQATGRRAQVLAFWASALRAARP